MISKFAKKILSQKALYIYIYIYIYIKMLKNKQNSFIIIKTKIKRFSLK